MADQNQVVSNKTKIIATLGPATASRERLTKLFDAGLDICRLNFSHGDLDGHQRMLDLLRSIAAERDQPICVIGDLCGPKIRLGRFDTPAELKAGDVVRFVRGEGGCSAERLTVTFAALIDEAAPGQRIFIDDGLVRLVVLERRADELVCECKAGGRLDSRKGVNLPDTPLTMPALTDKDRRDLDWAIEHGLEYVALSFVRQPDDLYELKRVIKQRGSGVRVIVKIEKTEAPCRQSCSTARSICSAGATCARSSGTKSTIRRPTNTPTAPACAARPARSLSSGSATTWASPSSTEKYTPSPGAWIATTSIRP